MVEKYGVRDKRECRLKRYEQRYLAQHLVHPAVATMNHSGEEILGNNHCEIGSKEHSRNACPTGQVGRFPTDEHE